MDNDLFGDRLLVIDDEPAFGQIVKRVAKACGFDVVVTDDPTAFTNAARQWRPTVIMLDLRMPGTDGIQLLRTLAADKCTAQIVVTSGEDRKVLGYGDAARSRARLEHERSAAEANSRRKSAGAARRV